MNYSLKVNAKPIAIPQVTAGPVTRIRIDKAKQVEVFNDSNGQGPARLETKRIGEDLLLSIKDEVSKEVTHSILIEDYYIDGPAPLVGSDAAGGFKIYQPVVEDNFNWIDKLSSGTQAEQFLGDQFAPAFLSSSVGLVPGLVMPAALGLAAANIASTPPAALGLSLATDSGVGNSDFITNVNTVNVTGLGLATDSGASNSDFITNVNRVNVTGLEVGATWEFSLNGGTSWSAGTGTSFDLTADTTFATGNVQVRQTDAAGNTSNAASNAQAWREDSSVPTPTVVDFTSSTVWKIRSTETVTAYLVKNTNTVSSQADILALPSNQWNSVAITSTSGGPGGLFNIPLGGLASGNYVLYSVDTAGNVSAASAAVAVNTPVISLASASFTSAANLGFQINGEALQDTAGVSVSSAGDVNGDGLDDLIVGAPFAQGGAGHGRAYVVFGKTDAAAVNLTTVAGGTGGFEINGLNNANLGTAVTGIGDINGDGLADIMVGAPAATAGAGSEGRSYVVFGKASTTAINLAAVSNGAGGFAIFGDTSSTFLSGGAVASAGDYNGDGLTDFIVGAPGRVSAGTAAQTGDAYLVYGTNTQQNIQLSAVAAGNGGFKLAGSGSQQMGFSVSAAGDLNGDGFADVVIGAPNDTAGAGKVYVRYGGTAASGSNGGFEITGAAGLRLGASVAGAGDVNGDGYADLIVGAPQRVTSTNAAGGQGRAYVVFGGPTGGNISSATLDGGTGGFAILGSTTNGDAGMSVSSVGDMNGDGLSDFIVGEDTATVDGLAQAGNTYVVFGKTNLTTVALSDVALGVGGFKLKGAAAFDRNGWSVSGAGDVNGDGLADLIVGAKGESLDETTLGAGKAYVVFGSATGEYYETAVDQVGTVSNNTLTSTGGQSLLGGQGNDTLISAGADVLYGGAGADVFVLSSAMLNALAQGFASASGTLARVDGGSGLDTLRISDGSTLDLFAIRNNALGLPADGSTGSRIQSIERVDLQTDTAANTLKLGLADVLDMSGLNQFNTAGGWAGTTLTAQVSKHQLLITGSNNDTVNLVDLANWTLAGADTLAGVNYNVYNHNTAQAQLLITQSITQII